MIVLLSGGLDSMVCAESERQNGRLRGCVFVDYGHPAQIQEGWKVFAYCGKHRVPLKVVHVFGLDLGDMAASVGARVVPARNAILLAAAANAALAMGGHTLVIGAIGDDQADYADCRPAFFEALGAALGLRVEAPLLRRTKREVVALAANLGLDLGETWSCYGPGPEPCGACPSCVSREVGVRP